jgi:hypothetical protein
MSQLYISRFLANKVISSFDQFDSSSSMLEKQAIILAIGLEATNNALIRASLIGNSIFESYNLI